MLMSMDLYREEWETVIAILEAWGEANGGSANSIALEIQEQKDKYRG
jgi:hypothetical protein